MTEKRLVILVAAFTFFAFVIELNMVYINVCGKYYDKAITQQYREYEIDDSRGIITDINFNNITNTTAQYRTLVTGYDDDLQQVFNSLTEREKRSFEDNVKYNTAFIANIDYPIEGRNIYKTTKRYSDFNIAQHLIGYTDGEGNGVSGLENVFDAQLKNSAEIRYLQANINGYRQIVDYTQHKRVNNDTNAPMLLTLTIDNTIQRLCEGIAAEYIPNGSVVVMETKTGKIKAMVSTPFYNANDVSAAMNKDNSPLLNKSLQAYEPGSVIKPLWAAVLLENGYNPEKIYNCEGKIEINGHEYHCNNDKAHGPINMQQALVVSCNCYFINAHMKDKSALYYNTGNLLNFGESIELAQGYFTTPGYFPTSEELNNLGQLASVSFGQGKFLLTPVHVAAYMNIFANNGVYVKPQVAQGFYNANTKELITNLYNLEETQVVDKTTASQVKLMLRSVVEEGAMSRAMPQFLSGGGKTGTAQSGRYDENGKEILTAWFCGFYPYENPKYTICITMYNGGESTYTAAPLFKKICDSIYYIL